MKSVEGFVNRVLNDLSKSDGSRGSAVTRRKLRTVVDACGWKKRSTDRLEDLIESLSDAGVYAEPDISDPDVSLDTYIRFTLEPPLPVGRTIKPERALGYWLSKYPDVLAEQVPDLGRLTHRYGGKTVERSFGGYKPDLVFSSASGRWLVCELKRGAPNHESLSQVRAYAAAVAAEGHDVTALLVTGKPKTRKDRDHTLRSIRDFNRIGLDVRWVTYDVDIVLGLEGENQLT